MRHTDTSLNLLSRMNPIGMAFPLVAVATVLRVLMLVGRRHRLRSRLRCTGGWWRRPVAKMLPVALADAANARTHGLQQVGHVLAGM